MAVEAVENTVKIADMCEDSSYLSPSGNHLPDFPCNLDVLKVLKISFQIFRLKIEKNTGIV